MANVLVNDRCLYHGRTGVATYLRYLLSSWPEGGPAMRGFCTHALLRRRSWPAASGPAETALALRPLSRLPYTPNTLPSSLRTALHGGYDLALRAGAAMSGGSVYFEPNHLAVSCSLPTVTTIHDLSVLMHPSWHPPDRVARWRRCLARAVAQTTRWIAVSEYTRDCLVRLLKVDPSAVTVIPLAPRFGPAGDGRASLLDRPYFLHVGTLEPRKNIPVLLDAYAAIPEAVRDEVALVLVGDWARGDPAFHRALVEHPVSASTSVAGYVSDDLLERLLRGATALLAPSHLEGFGLPVLEAMAVGTPVICSKAEAFVEVAGGAAEHVDASDTRGWAERMIQAAEDSSWRTARAQAGLARAREFSWAKTAAAQEGPRFHGQPPIRAKQVPTYQLARDRASWRLLHGRPSTPKGDGATQGVGEPPQAPPTPSRLPPPGGILELLNAPPLLFLPSMATRSTEARFEIKPRPQSLRSFG